MQPKQIVLKTEQHLQDKIIEDALSKQGVYIISDGIDSQLASGFCIRARYMHQTLKKRQPIRVVLNSPGGEYYAGIQMYSTIRELRAEGRKVIIEVQGQCSSMAVIILQSATRRVGRRFSRFMMHEVSIIRMSQEFATEVEETAAEIKRVNAAGATIIAERTGKPLSVVLAEIKKKDVWMDAQQALEYGILDEVID